MSLFIRPENLAIYGTGKILALYFSFRPRILAYFIVAILLVGAYFALPYAPILAGYEALPIAELPEFLDQFFKDRASRWTSSDGGGSNILGGTLFEMPFWQRYPLQILTFFLLPLPHEINSIAQALAFVDSLFFLVVSFVFLRRGDSKAKWLFWAYILIFGFFASNYGNMFRLRLPLYFVMVGGMRYRR